MANNKKYYDIFRQTSSSIKVTEHYELTNLQKPTRLVFMALTPDALKHIQYDKGQLEASIEDISDQLDPVLRKMWGEKMYRIILTVKSKKKKNTIKYTLL